MTKTSLQFCATVIAVALGLTVSATASLISEEAGSEPVAASATAVETNLAAKEDRLALAEDPSPRVVRCVSVARTTSCTGWPVAESFDVSGL